MGIVDSTYVTIVSDFGRTRLLAAVGNRNE